MRKQETFLVKDIMLDKKDTNGGQASKIENVFNTDSKTSPFSQNVNANKVYKRAERIVGVLYLLTKALPDQEPLKTSIRTKALNLVEESLNLKDVLRAESPVKDMLKARAHELMSMIRCAVIAGYVSRQNAELTIEALEELLLFMGSVSNSFLSEENVVVRSDLSVSDEIAEQAFMSYGVAHKHALPRITKKPLQNKQNQTQTKSSLASESHESRREVILALLKKSGPLGIKDVASHLTDCGEKTVQRELAALVDSGTLIKEGEKRWSKYKLAM